MAIDKTNLTAQVQVRIDGLTGSESLKDLLILRKAADDLNMDLSALDTAINNITSAFNGATDNKDLLLANKAGGLNKPTLLGEIVRLNSAFPDVVSLDGMTFTRNNVTINSGFDPSLEQAKNTFQKGITLTVPESIRTLYSTVCSIRCVAHLGGSEWLIGLNNYLGILKSEDNGATWSVVNSSNSSTYSESVDFISVDESGNCVALTSDDVYAYSVDGGDSWGMRTTPFLLSTNKTIMKTVAGEWIVGHQVSTTGYGVVRLHSSGSTANEELNHGGPSQWMTYTYVWFAKGATDSHIIFPSDRANYIWYSDSEGRAWSERFIGNIGAPAGNVNFPVGDESGVIVAKIGHVIIRSIDSGYTWSLGQDLTGMSTISYIQTDKQGNWIVLGSSGTNDAFRSTDNGVTWSPVEIIPPSSSDDFLYNEKAHYFNGVWYVPFQSGTGVSKPVEGYYISSDGGASWVRKAINYGVDIFEFLGNEINNTAPENLIIQKLDDSTIVVSYEGLGLVGLTDEDYMRVL